MMAEGTLKCCTSSFFQEPCTAQNQLLATFPLCKQQTVDKTRTPGCQSMNTHCSSETQEFNCAYFTTRQNTLRNTGTVTATCYWFS